MSAELKTPLRATWRLNVSKGIIMDADDNVVCVARLKADGTAIVHRVNCHDRLVEAMEGLLYFSSPYAGGSEDNRLEAISEAKAALTAAKGAAHD